MSPISPILIVEDDRKIARVVKVYLEGEGFKAILAERVEMPYP